MEPLHKKQKNCTIYKYILIIALCAIHSSKRQLCSAAMATHLLWVAFFSTLIYINKGVNLGILNILTL